MKKEIKFTVEESQQWDSDVLVKGATKHNGEIHNVSMYGRV